MKVIVIFEQSYGLHHTRNRIAGIYTDREAAEQELRRLRSMNKLPDYGYYTETCKVEEGLDG